MGSTLQQILRSLCSDTDWKYAVFWKLKHCSRMVLTLEDAYYDSDEQNNPLEVKGFTDTTKSLHGGHYPHDPLGLAVAKMSYHVYSLGEGIVGEVAVSGQHQWVFPEYYHNSFLTFENIWGSQISAGIKTILVVAVGPCGVVQLGSLRKVDEDLTLVARIRHLFLALQESSVDHATNLLQCSMNSSTFLPSLPSECLRVEAFPDYSGEVNKAVDVEGSDLLSQYACKRSGSLPNPSPMSFLLGEKAVQVFDGHGAGQVSISRSYQGVKHDFSVDLADAKFENQAGTDIICNALYEGETSSCGDLRRRSDPYLYPYSRNDVLNDKDSSASAIENVKLFAGQLYSDLDSAVHSTLKMDAECSPHNMVQVSERHREKYLKDSDQMLESEIKSSQFEAWSASVSSFAGSELLEALGPAFSERSAKSQEQVKSETGATVRLTDDFSHSQLTFDSSAENLLDAVVGNACHSDGNVRMSLSMLTSSVNVLIRRSSTGKQAFWDQVALNKVQAGQWRLEGIFKCAQL